MIEPVFIGAGGFKLVDPLFQHLLVVQCKARGIPVVFDEVAVGMWRVGPSSTSQLLQVTPDIASYGKLLTGGYLPLAVTLATEETFNAFLGSHKALALLHGHSYTANPISCAAALEAIRQFQSSERYDWEHDRMRSHFTEEQSLRLSLAPGVASSVCMGSILAIELIEGFYDDAEVAPAVRLVQLLRQNGVYARPLGGTLVYLMTSQVTSNEESSRLIFLLDRCFTALNTAV